MRRGIILFFTLIFMLLLLVGPAAVRYLSYYRLTGKPAVATPPAYDPLDVVALVPTPPANEFVDEPTAGRGGLILLDESHANNFTLDEINYLDSRLAARGFELVPFRGGDLRSALRPVNAFIVITPISPFDRDEIVAIADFVNRGGRLLMVGDPTRFTVSFIETDFDFTFQLDTDRIPLNSLANEFDLEFNGDYLYNTVENEGNFRNILLKDGPSSDGTFAENGLTDGLQTLAFYGAHSVQVGPTAEAILTADDNTWSSATDRPGNLVLAAVSQDDHVLAVGDVDFLADPYRTVYDNSQFIARVADFLTENGERTFALSDFPFFYSSQVDLVYTGAPDLGPDAFDEVIALQEAFRRAGINLSLAATADDDNDALYLGLYNQSEDVAALLEAADITLVIDPAIVEETEEEEPAEESELTEEPTGDDEEPEVTRLIQSTLGNLQMSGTAVILLNEDDGRRQVIVLAASNDGLENTVGRLLDLMPLDGDYALADCLLQDQLALCPTGVSDEAVEAKLETGGVPDTTTGDGGDDDDGGEGGDGLAGTTDQGDIALGDSVEGTLDEEEAHSWTFSDGPALVDIVLQGSDDMDAVLELYDSDDELLETADSTFSGGEEIIAAINLDDGSYTIVVRDYFDDGGDYTLEVREAEEIEPEPIDADDQGEIGLDEEQSGTLDPEQQHAWTFVTDSDGDFTITLTCGEELDGVLAMYDEDGGLVDEVDSGLTGEPELLFAPGLPAGTYTIVVSDYFGDGGSYSLLVESGISGGNTGGAGIFIFEDDDGVALAGGFTSATPLSTYLNPTHEVTVWNVTDDGPLEDGQLDSYDLVIWDTGDYRDEENAFEQNTLVIFDYLSRGGNVLVTGLVPAIFEPAELAPIADVEFIGDDAILLDGLESGDVIELDDTYDAVVVDANESDLEELDVAFIARGPQSDPAGAYVGLASASEEFSGGKLLLLSIPFVTLPEDIQQTLLANMLNWLGV